MSEKPKLADHPPESLPRMRPFSWRAFWILGFLYIVGKVASIPLLRATDIPLGSLLTVAVHTAITLVTIGVSLFLAIRTELGAPLLEGLLGRQAITSWATRVLALSLLTALLGGLLVLLLNLGVPEHPPAAWALVLASLDAGIQEELFYRFFLMTLMVWGGVACGMVVMGLPPGSCTGQRSLFQRGSSDGPILTTISLVSTPAPILARLPMSSL